MLAHLDAAERHQVVDQPAHPPRLARHDGQEPVARRRIIAGVMLKGLDVADDRRERRAKLMAGVRDEIRAHPLGAARARPVLELDDRTRLVARPAFGRQETGAGLEGAVPSLVGGEFERVLQAVGQRGVHRFDESRRPDRLGEMRSGLETRQSLVRGAVGEGDEARAGDDQDRRGQFLDQRAACGVVAVRRGRGRRHRRGDLVVPRHEHDGHHENRRAAEREQEHGRQCDGRERQDASASERERDLDRRWNGLAP